MHQIGFLGTGGSAATLERDNASLVLNRNGELILIDCPGSCSRKLMQMGLNPERVRALFITHTHPDHVYGLPGFIHSRMSEDTVLNLYGSEETIRFCRDLLDMFQLRDSAIRIRVKFISLRPLDSFQPLPGIQGQAFSVPHKASSLAVCFDLGDNTSALLYSGDTAVHPGLFQQAPGIHTLIHDCSTPSRLVPEYDFLAKMHTDSLSLGRMAERAGIKRLIPIHFLGELDFSLDEVITEIRQNYSGRLLVPEDLQLIDY